MLEQFASFIHDRAFAARALTRIDAEHGLGTERCGEQQLAQVLGEHVDGAFVGAHLELDAHVHLYRMQQQTLHAVLDRARKLAGPGRRSVQFYVLFHERQDIALIDVQACAEHALCLPAANRQIAMRRDLRDRLLELGVAVELGGLVFEVFGFADADRAVAHVRFTGVLAHFRIFGDALGANISRAGQRCGDVCYFFLGVDEALRAGAR